MTFNSDLVSLWFAEEQTFGTPDTSATLIPFRMTQESLKRNSEYTESQELTPDAQVADTIRVDIGGGGTVPYEFSHNSFETQIAAVLRNYAPTPRANALTHTGSTNLSFTASDNSINRASGSWITDGWRPGMRLQVASTTSNNGRHYVRSVAALKLTITADTTIVDEANTSGVVRSGSRLTGTTISFDAASQEIRDSGNGFVTAGFKVGDWITVPAAAASNNASLHRVDSVAAGAMVLSHGDAITTAAAGASLTVDTERYVENGIYLPTYTFERRYEEAASDANKYVQFPGHGFNSMSMNTAAKAIVGGEFGLVGKDEVDGGGASYGAADGTRTTTRVLNAVTGVSAVFENGATFRVTAIQFNLENGVEALSEVAVEGASEIAAGKFRASGQVTIFYRESSKATFDKYLDGTPTSFAIKFTDVDGNIDVVEFPYATLTDGARNAGGTDSRIQATFNFTATKDPTEGKTCRWVFVD